MDIRAATRPDLAAIRDIHLAAFPETERDSVAQLAVDLLTENSDPHVISLVADDAGRLVGHVAFSPVTDVGNPEFRGYLLSPLGVIPSRQKQSIGSDLVNRGMQQLRDSGIGILFVYGDPAYYGRFGFDVRTARGCVPPYSLQYPSGWQAVELNPGGRQPDTVRIRCVASLSHPELW